MRLRKSVFRRWDDDTLHRWSKITLQVAIVAGAVSVLCLFLGSEYGLPSWLFAVFAFILIGLIFVSMQMLFELDGRSIDRIVDLLAEYDKRHGGIEMETKEDFERFLKEGKRP